MLDLIWFSLCFFGGYFFVVWCTVCWTSSSAAFPPVPEGVDPLSYYDH